jgi:hypothetical protein
MNDPQCGFGADDKYCPVLWAEHAAAEQVVAAYLEYKKTTRERVLRIIDVHTLGLNREAVVKLRLKIEQLFNEETS